MPKGCTCLALLLPFLMLACSGGSDHADPNVVPDTTLTATLADSGETHLLRDGLKPLGNITTAVSAGESRLVVADDQPSVTLFEDHVMTRTFGQAGNGPCEYGGSSGIIGITAVDTSGDSLFILLDSQQKIISFRISTGECLGETSHPGLSQRQYLERVKGGFLTGRSRYSSNSPDTTRMLSLLRDDETMVPVNLYLDTIDPAPMPMPVVIPGINFARHGNRIYAGFPFSQVLAEVEIATLEVRMLPLHIDINREAFEEAGSISRQNLEFISQADIVGRLHATDRWIAVSTRRPREREGPVSKVYFQSPEGELMGEQILDDTPYALHGDRLLFIEPVQDPDSDYTYQVIYREVILQ